MATQHREDLQDALDGRPQAVVSRLSENTETQHSVPCAHRRSRGVAVASPLGHAQHAGLWLDTWWPARLLTHHLGVLARVGDLVHDCEQAEDGQDAD